MRAPRQRPAGDGGRDSARRRPRGRRGARRAAWRLRGVGRPLRRDHRRRGGSDETREMSVDELEEALQEEASPDDDPADAVETPRARASPRGPGVPLDRLARRVARGRAGREPEQVQVPEPEGRITVESRPRSEEETVFERHAHAHEPEPTTVDEVEQLRRTRLAELVEEHPRAEEHARPAEEARTVPTPPSASRTSSRGRRRPSGTCAS